MGAERHAAAHGLRPPASRLSSPLALSGGRIDDPVLALLAKAHAADGDSPVA